MSAPAAAAGFFPDAAERCARIVALLEEIGGAPGLQGGFAVAGGAALHLGSPNPPRLTGDLDLHHVCSAGGEELALHRDRVEAALHELFVQCSLAPMRWTNDVGVRWTLYGPGNAGNVPPLRVDFTTLVPVPLWPLEALRPVTPGGRPGPPVPRLSLDEMAGNKVGTLFIRRRSRDLYDAHRLLTRGGPDGARLRAGFVLAVLARPLDPRTLDAGRVDFSREEMLHNLVPCLSAEERARAEEDPRWAEAMLEETREAVSRVLPLEPREREFVGRLRDHGQLMPELLTDDEALAERIRRNGVATGTRDQPWKL